MNSGLPYALIPVVAAIALAWWARTRDDRRVVRRLLLTVSGMTAAALVASTLIMLALARVVGGRARAVEVLAAWSFVLTLGIVYAALRNAVHLALRWTFGFRDAGERSPGWLEAMAAVASLLLFVPYLFTAANVHRPKIGNAVTPHAVGLSFEPVALRAEDGVRLSGWFVPAEGDAKATVLICHGVGANSGDMLPVARWLHDEAYHVMLFDFRGHGDSAGHVTSFGYHEALDVAAAVGYLREREDCDANKLVGYAFSMGSSALTLSLREGNPFCAVVLDSPFGRLSEMQEQQLARLGPVRRPVSALVTLFGRMELGVTPPDIAPADYVDQLSPAPLFIIHGEADRTIPVSQARALFAGAEQPKALWIVPGADHGAAMVVAGATYREKVTAFLDRGLPSAMGSPPQTEERLGLAWCAGQPASWQLAGYGEVTTGTCAVRSPPDSSSATRRRQRESPRLSASDLRRSARSPARRGCPRAAPSSAGR